MTDLRGSKIDFDSFLEDMITVQSYVPSDETDSSGRIALHTYDLESDIKAILASDQTQKPSEPQSAPPPSFKSSPPVVQTAPPVQIGMLLGTAAIISKKPNTASSALTEEFFIDMDEIQSALSYQPSPRSAGPSSNGSIVDSNSNSTPNTSTNTVRTANSIGIQNLPPAPSPLLPVSVPAAKASFSATPTSFASSTANSRPSSQQCSPSLPAPPRYGSIGSNTNKPQISQPTPTRTYSPSVAVPSHPPSVSSPFYQAPVNHHNLGNLQVPAIQATLTTNSAPSSPTITPNDQQTNWGSTRPARSGARSEAPKMTSTPIAITMPSQAGSSTPHSLSSNSSTSSSPDPSTKLATPNNMLLSGNFMRNSTGSTTKPTAAPPQSSSPTLATALASSSDGSPYGSYQAVGSQHQYSDSSIPNGQNFLSSEDLPISRQRHKFTAPPLPPKLSTKGLQVSGGSNSSTPLTSPNNISPPPAARQLSSSPVPSSTPAVAPSTTSETPSNPSSFTTFESLLFDTNITILKALCTCLQVTESTKTCASVVLAYEAKGKTLKMIQSMIEYEVSQQKTAATLFRNNSLTTHMMTCYTKLVGLPFLKTVIGPVISEAFAAIESKSKSFEIDPQKVSNSDDMGKNVGDLKKLVHSFFDRILNSRAVMPKSFMEICGTLQSCTVDRFPESRYFVIGGFLFLRYICPAVVAPDGYKLLEGEISAGQRRMLVLVSKILQTIANERAFGDKEEFMMCMNPLVSEYQGVVQYFFNQLAKPVNPAAPANIPVLFFTPEDYSLALKQVHTQVVGLKAKLLAHSLVQQDPKVVAAIENIENLVLS